MAIEEKCGNCQRFGSPLAFRADSQGTYSISLDPRCLLIVGQDDHLPSSHCDTPHPENPKQLAFESTLRAQIKDLLTPLPEVVSCGTCRHFNDFGALGHNDLAEPIRGICRLWGTHQRGRRVGTDGCNWRDFMGNPAYEPRLSDIFRRFLHIK